MTKLSIIKEHKRQYSELEARISAMYGLEKVVAQYITLSWIKGNNWMGGLSDRVAESVYNKVVSLGYTLEEVDAEAMRQMEEIY